MQGPIFDHSEGFAKVKTIHGGFCRYNPDELVAVNAILPIHHTVEQSGGVRTAMGWIGSVVLETTEIQGEWGKRDG